MVIIKGVSMGLKEIVIAKGIQYALGEGGKLISEILKNNDTSSMKNVLKKISGEEVSDADARDFIEVAKAVSNKSDDQRKKEREQRRKEILGSPKDYILDIGMNVISEGLHGSGDIIRNNANRLAEAILSAYSGTTGEQESRYGADKFSNIMKGVAVNKIRKGETASKILDSIGNVVDTSYGTYKSNKDKLSTLSLMEDSDNKLPAAAFDYFSTNERIKRGSKKYNK